MKVSQDTALASYTSLHAGGKAQTLIQLEPNDDLQTVLKSLPSGQPVWVLGFGTNVLVSDKGLAGTVILNQAGQIEDQGNGRFKLDSGVLWDDFTQQAIAKNRWGLEFTSGIPGGVGAAVAGNIAAYGHKVADSFVSATILNSKDGSLQTWDNPALGFTYRGSRLQLPENGHLLVLDATFKLKDRSTGELEYESAQQTARELGVQPDSLANRRKIILETRRRAGSLLQDKSVGPWTAGSFFKNPLVDEDQVQRILEYEERPISRQELLRQNVIHGESKQRVSAAHVLLAAGFKRGQSWGPVRLHPDHILKIENLGQATAQQIYDVVQEVVKTVRERLGIDLEPEVRFIGEF